MRIYGNRHSHLREQQSTTLQNLHQMSKYRSAHLAPGKLNIAIADDIGQAEIRSCTWKAQGLYSYFQDLGPGKESNGSRND